MISVLIQYINLYSDRKNVNIVSAMSYCVNVLYLSVLSVKMKNYNNKKIQSNLSPPHGICNLDDQVSVHLIINMLINIFQWCTRHIFFMI